MDLADQLRGHDATDTFRPAEYGDYIATSNAVYACTTLRADLLASLPIRFWLGRGADRTEVVDGPLIDLFRRVNPYWTFERLLNMTEVTLGVWGEAFWVIDRGRNGRGTPREIWWAKPTHMRVVPHATDYISGFLYEPQQGGPPIPLLPSEVLWLRYPNPLDEYAGLSPVAAARLAADLEQGAAKSNRNLFSQGVQMGGAVFPKGDTQFSVEQATELEQLLDRRFRGVDKAHKWAVFRTEMQLQQVGVTPRDAEFLGTLNWSLDSVARAYRVPVEAINGPGKCVDPETEALTARGWVAGDDLTEQDTILACDPATGELKWSPVLGIYRAHHEGVMYRHTSQQIDMLITPNHKLLLADGQKKTVDELRRGDLIRTMGEAEAGAPDAEYSNAFVELVGWAVTEGHYERTRPSSMQDGRRVYGPYTDVVRRIVISQKDGPNADRIAAVLKESGARWSDGMQTGRDIRRFGVMGEVATAIATVAPDRVLSCEFLLALTADQRELLLQTMIDADGHRGSSLVFVQKSKPATDAFVMLATLTGRSAYSKFYRRAGAWTTIVRARKTMRNGPANVPVAKRTERVAYSGPVWCPQTLYGTFVCRRAGKVHVTSNSYINFPTALRALWQLAIIPEARFIASEITEQILPMFGRGGADTAEFDFRHVESLRDDEMPLWDRVLAAYDKGLLGEATALNLLGVEQLPDDRRKLALNMALVPTDGAGEVIPAQKVGDDTPGDEMPPTSSNGHKAGAAGRLEVADPALLARLAAVEARQPVVVHVDAPKPLRRRVERDEHGRLVGLVDEADEFEGDA